ncbi:NLRP3 protein, partial [Amia calva]|nr:NLRP3 protein [Amia calva]
KLVQVKLKNCLKRFECIHEGIAKPGKQTFLNSIYTELYITEGDSGEVNNEHEVRQIEMATKKKHTQETPIKCRDIFKPLPGQNKPIRTVLTKGIAGIGKTVSVQKFMDWATGEANQDIQLIFVLPFRELNLIQMRNYTLLEFLQNFLPELKEVGNLESGKYTVLLIFDGLDESRFSLDFQNSEICRDVTQSMSVNVLLTNLIRGNLLPSALLWITTRPAAQALQSKNGHLDLVVRFLFGILMDSSQRGSLTQTHGSSQSSQKTTDYIKQLIRKNPSPERCINLFHCLNELNDNSLVEEIQSFLSSGSDSGRKLSSEQLSALVFVLLTSEESLDEFDLKKYSRSEEGCLKLLPVIRRST